MVTIVSMPSIRCAQPRPYPLPWNTTSTLRAATNAQYFYDYAGQDPINNHDLSGTVLMDTWSYQAGSNPNAVECDITGCGVVRLDYSNSGSSGIAWGRTAEAIGLAASALDLGGELADVLAAVRAGGIRAVLDKALVGFGETRSEALVELKFRIKLGAGEAADFYRAQGSGMSPEELLTHLINHFLKGFFRGLG